DARSTRQEEEARRARARKERDDAQRDLEAATSSLADLQKGLEELQRRASAHSLATRRMERAQSLLPDSQVDVDTVGQVLSDGESRYDEQSKEFRHLFNRVRNAEQHRLDFEHVYQALVAISGEETAPSDAFRAAQAVSRQLRALEATAAQREE